MMIQPCPWWLNMLKSCPKKCGETAESESAARSGRVETVRWHTRAHRPWSHRQKKSGLWSLLSLAELCFFGALWTEPICPNRMMSCDTKITMNMIMFWSEKWNLGIRSRSVSTVRWEQKASGWSLSSFSIYNHKTHTHTHTHWWLYNLIHIQYYTSDCNISTQIMDYMCIYIYIHDYIYVYYVSVCCSILFHYIRF